ncbi:MAG: YebC/PmpR family DNA-binding transcriptional regulator [Candidatus Improbicoccus devescovinae]|nr:MAG: YebC/PmpR family DNA-binding transcriptional regulator [Candidatus Improbicoccus devescovinae]
MSGHSRWSTIKRKKEKSDAQKGKIFTKIGRELSVAAREGGSDLNVNFKLRECIIKARSFNVPNENIERIIKKAVSSDNSENYEAFSYEGYGPSGVAFIVDILTDNRNRTAANLRRYFDRSGGNLGTPGCVSFMFNQKGVIIIEKSGLSEEVVMTDAIEAGAADFQVEDEVFVIIAERKDYENVNKKLKKYRFISSQLSMVPDSYIKINDTNTKNSVLNFIDILENDDDVQDVWHNCELNYASEADND